MRYAAFPTGLLCLSLLIGCGQDSPTGAAAPEEAEFYRVKPGGSGADQNGNGITCTQDNPSDPGPYLIDDDGAGNCPAGYSPYGG